MPAGGNYVSEKIHPCPFPLLSARYAAGRLRRRCAYLYIQYPDMDKELAILRAKLPHIDDRLAHQVALAVQNLRSNEAILKKPSIAETLDWAAALDALGVRELTPDALRQTAGFILKNTLSDNGGVTRGVCKVDANGNLADVEEVGNIVKDNCNIHIYIASNDQGTKEEWENIEGDFKKDLKGVEIIFEK